MDEILPPDLVAAGGVFAWSFDALAHEEIIRRVSFKTHVDPVL